MDTKTAGLILEHIPVFDVASIIISYLEPENKENMKQYAITGFYEKCMDISDVNEGLYDGCECGYIDIVHLMIKNGADKLNAGLLWACGGGHMDIVKLLIKEGANNWDWGLYGACLGGHMDIVKLMIGNGAIECYSCSEPLDRH